MCSSWVVDRSYSTIDRCAGQCCVNLKQARVTSSPIKKRKMSAGAQVTQGDPKGSLRLTQGGPRGSQANQPRPLGKPQGETLSQSTV